MFGFLKSSLLTIACAAPSTTTDQSPAPNPESVALSHESLGSADLDLDAVLQESSPEAQPKTAPNAGEVLACKVGVPLAIGIDPATKEVQILYRDASKVTDQELEKFVKNLTENPSKVETILCTIQKGNSEKTFALKQTFDDSFVAVEQPINKAPTAQPSPTITPLSDQAPTQVPTQPAPTIRPLPDQAPTQSTSAVPTQSMEKPFEIRMANDALGVHKPIVIDPVLDKELFDLTKVQGLDIKCSRDQYGRLAFELRHYDNLKSKFTSTDTEWKPKLASEIKELSLKVGNIGSQPTAVDITKLSRADLVEVMSQLEAQNKGAEREIRMKSSLATALTPPANVRNPAQEAQRRDRAVTQWEQQELRQAANDFNKLTAGGRETPTERQNKDLARRIDSLNQQNQGAANEILGQRMNNVRDRQARLASRITADGLDDWLKEVADKGQVIIDGNSKDVGVIKQHVAGFIHTDFGARAQQILERGDGKTPVYIAPSTGMKLTTDGFRHLSEDDLRQRVQSLYDRNHELSASLVEIDARLDDLGLTPLEATALQNATATYQNKEKEFFDREMSAQGAQAGLLAEWDQAQTQREYRRQARLYLDYVRNTEAAVAEREYTALRRYYDSDKSLGGSITGGAEDVIRGGVKEVFKETEREVKKAAKDWVKDIFN